MKSLKTGTASKPNPKTLEPFPFPNKRGHAFIDALEDLLFFGKIGTCVFINHR